jgi:hypothetical protein
MKQIKKDFILTIALTDSHGSAFRRANVYSKDASEIDKGKFAKMLRQKLKSLEQGYLKGVTEAEHIGNIERFGQELTEQFSHVLAGNKMRFGISQKAVNLYLKYLWVLGYIPQPPHCPIDRVILNEVGIYHENWTQLDDVEKYMGMIGKLKERADKDKLTIAEWELKCWNGLLVGNSGMSG